MSRKRLSILMTLLMILQLICNVNITYANTYIPLDTKYQLSGSDINARIYFVDSDHNELFDDQLKNVNWNDNITFRCDFSFNPDILRAKYESIPGVTTGSNYVHSGGSPITTAAFLTTTTAVLYCDIKVPSTVYLPDTTLLPLNCTVDGTTENLGNCYINKAAHIVTLQFNASVLYESWSSNISGYIEVGCQFDQSEISMLHGGQQVIKFFDGFNNCIGSQAVGFLSEDDMLSKLAGTATLTKKGNVILADDGESYIEWTLLVTPTTETFSRGIIVDEIKGKIPPTGVDASIYGGKNGLSFDSSSLTLKTNSRTFSIGYDENNYQYSFSPSSMQLTLYLPKLDKATDKVLTITYKTPIYEKALLDINNIFHNSASLYKVTTTNPLTVLNDVTTTINMKWISKSAKITNTDVDTKKVTVLWTINVNPLRRMIENPHILDTLQYGLKYLDNSLTIKDLTTNTDVTIMPDTVKCTSIPDPTLKTRQCDDLDINLGLIDTTHEYQIQFKTTIDSSQNQTVFNNTPILKTDQFTVKGSPCSLGVATSCVSKSNVWDPQTHSVTWTIYVNNSKYKIKQGSRIEDTIETDTTMFWGLPKAGYTLVDGTLNYPTDIFDLTWELDNTTHKKKMVLTTKKEIHDSYQITYTTKLNDDAKQIWGNNSDWSTAARLQNDVFLRNSNLPDCRAYTTRVPESQVIAKQASGFNYATRRITWTVVVNKNQMSIPNAKVIDKLCPYQEYDFNSIKVFKNSDTENIYKASKLSKFSTDSGQGFCYNFGNIAQGDSYKLVYDTIVKNDLFMDSTTYKISNKAYISGDTIFEAVDLPFIGGKGVEAKTIYRAIPYETIVKKSLTSETDTYALWTIYINPLNAPLGDKRITVIDDLDPALKLDLTSIKLYQLNVDASFKISTNESAPIPVDPKDISYDYDPATHKNTFTYKLPATMSHGTESYALEFGTDISYASNYKEIKNSASFKCDLTSDESQDTQKDASVKINLSYSAATIGGKRGANLCITKINSISNKPAPGAVFECYYYWNDTKVVKATATSDTNGKVTFYGLAIGTTYFVQEKSAPTGYLLSNEILEITPTDADKNKTIQKVFFNTPLNKCQTVTFTKTDALSSSIKVKDAVYELHYTSSSPERLINTYTTDENGEIHIDKLSPGAYEFREKIAPIGYEVNATPVSFTVSDNDVLNLSSTDKRKVTSIKLLKLAKYGYQDASQALPLKDVKFKLFRDNPGPLTQIGGIYTTNTNGECLIPDLEWGHYYFQEIDVPKGYELSTQKHEFEITKNDLSTATPKVVQIINTRSSGKLHIEKTDIETTEALSDVEFTLYYAATASDPFTIFNKYITDSEGKKEISDLPWGYYKLKETRPKEGYRPCEDLFTFEINNTNVYIPQVATYKNLKQKGYAKLTKYISGTTTPLEGACYDLYNVSSFSPIFIQSYITNDAGEIITNILPAGKYEWREKTAPTGYKVNETPISFDIDNELVSVKDFDSRLTKNVSLLKFDESSHMPLEGATFNLVRCDISPEVIIDTLQTDANGHITVSYLDWGDYYFEEIDVPQGYTLSKEKKFFSVTKENVQDPNPLELTFGNTRKLGLVKIIKKDSSTNDLLSGTQFTLYKDGLIYNTYETINGIIAISNLPWGSYRLQETKASPGYILSNKSYTFKLTAKNVASPQVIEVKNTRKLGTATILKLDAITRQSLSGAQIVLYDHTGTCIKQLITDQSGYATATNLDWGDYYFQELVAPSGYQLSEVKLPISINATNVEKVQKVELTNTPTDPPKTSDDLVPDVPPSLKPSDPVTDYTSSQDSSEVDPHILPDTPNNPHSRTLLKPTNIPMTNEGFIPNNFLTLPIIEEHAPIAIQEAQNNSLPNGLTRETIAKRDNKMTDNPDKTNAILPKTGGIVDTKRLSLLGILLLALGEDLTKRRKRK